MPIPKPREGEAKNDFMFRCMSDDVMQTEYPTQKQRSAVCNVAFTDMKKSKETPEQTEKQEAIFKFKKQKEDDDQQLVFGFASVSMTPEGKQVVDFHKDAMDIDDLEFGAYDYVLNSGESGVQHKGETIAYLVESFMFTKEKMETLGIPEGTIPQGWWVGFFVPDKEVFEKVKNCELNMFSVQGQGLAIDLDLEDGEFDVAKE